ncbi:MAG: hypothetical protein RDV41_01050 [Planctomycetota bacterium]|nr:hypothetical protein [Planctomycetota bacterium]
MRIEAKHNHGLVLLTCTLLAMSAAVAGCGGTSAPRRTPAKEPVVSAKAVQVIELARGGLLCDGRLVIDRVGVADGVLSVTFKNNSGEKVRLECAPAFYDGAGHEVRNGLVDWRPLELEPQRSAVLKWNVPRAHVVATRLLARVSK